MGFQKSINSVIGTVAAANKVKQIAPSGEGGVTIDGSKLKRLSPMETFQKANQGLLNSYLEKAANLDRQEKSLRKMGKWGKEQDDESAYYQKMIHKYLNMDKMLKEYGKGDEQDGTKTTESTGH